MNDDHFAIGETLIRYVHEIYAACECTQKVKNAFVLKILTICPVNANV